MNLHRRGFLGGGIAALACALSGLPKPAFRSLGTPIQFASAGALPAGIRPGTIYHVVNNGSNWIIDRVVTFDT